MDYLSFLPNDLISLILSLLSPEEAARNSILSRRWRHPWKNSLTHLDIADCNIRPAFAGIWSLRSITLSDCTVTDAAMDSIVAGCTLLEKVVVTDALELRKIRVSVSLSRLKHMEITDCIDLRSIFIESPNLTTLYYDLASPLEEHHLVAPCLKEATLHSSGWHMSSTTAMAMLESSDIENLEKVSLSVHLRREAQFEYRRPCVLNRVKELSLELVALGKDLRGVDALLRVSSSLKSIHLSLACPYFSGRRESPHSGGDWTHRNLEKIRVDRFDYKTSSYLLLLEYLAGVSVRLVEIEIKVVCTHSRKACPKAKKCIEDCIGDKLCKGAKLVILP